MPDSSIKAVIFDIGGVVTKSPLIAIAEYEREHNIPHNYINNAIVRRGGQGAWQKFERGEMPLLSFYHAFGEELSDVKTNNVYFAEYCRKRSLHCPDLPRTLSIDGRDLFVRMMRTGSSLDELVVSAVQKIRATKRWRVFALTNNYSKTPSTLNDFNSDIAKKYPEITMESEMKHLGWDEGAVPLKLRAMFDDFVDSSEVGMRKPEPEFYLLACKRNGVRPQDAVFLDDLGLNCKAASELGMRAIQVRMGESQQALKVLEGLLGIALVDETEKKARL
ncbi:HAD-like protein [Peniophora sp. CONT]|nr:HAD-like protein [Peniophora sp. CONT]